ncbi:MAG: rod shape-determining protein MreC [Bacteroidota bacterium]
MRNLFEFIWKNHFVFLFIFLEIIASFFILQNNSFHKASFINSSNFFSASILNTFDNITGYLRLRSTNELLAAENEKLYSQSILSFIKYYNREFQCNDSIYKQQYTYLSALVINNSICRRNNYLTLNKGKNQGVQPGMGVISGNGIVGIVKDVSDRYSSVLSVLNKNARISAKIKKNGYFGSVIWDGADFQIVTLLDIPKHVKINKGDTIITSGYSSIFPDGILIGTIIDFIIEPGGNSHTISVKLSTDFSRLSYVYIVNNLTKEEQKSLEEVSQNE